MSYVYVKRPIEVYSKLRHHFASACTSSICVHERRVTWDSLQLPLWTKRRAAAYIFEEACFNTWRHLCRVTRFHRGILPNHPSAVASTLSASFDDQRITGTSSNPIRAFGSAPMATTILFPATALKMRNGGTLAAMHGFVAMVLIWSA